MGTKTKKEENTGEFLKYQKYQSLETDLYNFMKYHMYGQGTINDEK